MFNSRLAWLAIVVFSGQADANPQVYGQSINLPEAVTRHPTTEKQPIKGKNRLSTSGYIMLDRDYYGPFYNKESRVNQDDYRHKDEIRRAKVGLEYQLSDMFSSELQVKYTRSFPDKGEISLADAMMKFSLGNNRLQFGKMKQTLGLEQQTGSSKLISIERSLGNIFTPDRSYGVQLSHKSQSLRWALGYYINRDMAQDGSDAFSLSHFNLFTQSEEDIESYALHTNHNWFTSKNTLLHLGASMSHHDLSGNLFQIKSSGEVHSADKVIRSARFYALSNHLNQIELLLLNKQFLLQAEAMHNQVKDIDDSNWNYYSAYLQASFRFDRNYQYKSGKLKNKRYKRNKNSLYGLEIVLRQSYLDVRDHNIGSEASISQLGINIYPAKNFKLMANIQKPSIAGNTVNTNQSGLAFTLRGQYSF